MPTQLWAVQAALVGVYETAVGASVKVHRGPFVRTATHKKYVLVGTDGGSTGVDNAADGDMDAVQDRSDMGPGTWRQEAGTVTCSAWVWTGSSNAEIPREDAEGVYEACEAALFADRSIGGLLPNTGLAEISAVGIREAQTGTGPVVRVRWVVSYGALLTS